VLDGHYNLQLISYKYKGMHSINLGVILADKDKSNLFIYLFIRLYNVSTSSCAHLTTNGLFSKFLFPMSRGLACCINP